MEQHLDLLLANPREVLARLQRRFHTSNCPSSAAATHRFLQGRQARLAGNSLSGGFICTEPTATGTRVERFVSIINGGAIGNCAVIGAFGGRNREHYFNIIKLTDGVYYVDAFTRPAVFDQNIVGRTSGANQFEFFRDFRCRPVR